MLWLKMALLGVGAGIVVGGLTANPYLEWTRKKQAEFLDHRNPYCQKNLRAILQAKQSWAKDQAKVGKAEPAWSDLVPRYLPVMPRCVHDCEYRIGPVSATPTCPVARWHALPQ